MAAIPVVVAIALAVWFMYRDAGGAREACVKAFLVLFLLIAAITEAGSLFHALTRPVLAAVWLGLAGLAVGLLGRAWRRGKPRSSPRLALDAIAACDRTEQFFLWLIAVVLITTLVVALAAPPNTWDSMTYHMARVAEWAQHRSVAFYATNIERQNYQMPLAEFAILQLQLLSGSDLFANLVQWCSFGVCLLLASLIARELGGVRRVQLFAAVFAATIPMAVLQASSTQNDLVTAAFCLAFALFLLRLVREVGGTSSSRVAPAAGVPISTRVETTRPPALSTAAWCGLALGLALLTKGTAYLYCGAAGVVLGVVGLIAAQAGQRRWMLARHLVLAVAIGLALNVGHLTRNWQAYGKLLSPEPELYGNAALSPGILFANLVRNVALHLAVPLGSANQLTYRAVEALLGAAMNDARSTWMWTQFSVDYWLHEGVAGSPLHLVFTLVAMSLLAARPARQSRALTGYAFAIAAGAVLFCAVLKWQPWAGRLHTPLFMLAAPLAAVIVGQGKGERRTALIALAAVLAVWSLPFLAANQTRPLLEGRNASVMRADRLRQYFADRPKLYDGYIGAVGDIVGREAQEVGLYVSADDWEYPIWVLAERLGNGRVPQFRHVGVHGPSACLLPSLPPPPFVLSTLGKVAAIQGAEYEPVFESSSICVLKLKPTRATSRQ